MKWCSVICKESWISCKGIFQTLGQPLKKKVKEKFLKRSIIDMLRKEKDGIIENVQ